MRWFCRRTRRTSASGGRGTCGMAAGSDSRQVNIWPEIQSDGVGLADEYTLQGTLRLLIAGLH